MKIRLLNILKILYISILSQQNYVSSNNTTDGKLQSPNPEIGLNTTEYIRFFGYNPEEYTVVTNDGYLVKIQRIVPKKTNNKNVKTPILLMHGIMGSSEIWVDNGKDSLAFILSDYGYDVWLGNIRGSPHGRQHLQHDVNSEQFWDFSFHENAEGDVASTIDFILNKTHSKQLFYIGYSMGSTMMFVLLSVKPEYNAKVAGFLALGPVSYVSYILPSMKFLLDSYNTGQVLFRVLSFLNQHEISPSSLFRTLMMKIKCRNNEKSVCDELLFTIFGEDTSLLNKSRLSIYVDHSSRVTSLKTLQHYHQLYNSRKFSNYDYGKNNKNIYGKSDPPKYNLKKVSAPVALFWAELDTLADPHDVKRLSSELPNVVLNYRVPYKKFYHANFVWALNIRKLLYNKVIKTLQLMHYKDNSTVLSSSGKNSSQKMTIKKPIKNLATNSSN